jgi:hypothetical protein
MLYCFCPSYFSTLFNKVQDFIKKNIENKICIFGASEFSVWIISRPQNNSAPCYHCTKLVFTYSTGSSVIFELNQIFLYRFRKIFKQPNPLKIHPVQPKCSMRSNTTKLTVTFAFLRTGRKYPWQNVCIAIAKYCTWLNGIGSILQSYISYILYVTGHVICSVCYRTRGIFCMLQDTLYVVYVTGRVVCSVC